MSRFGVPKSRQSVSSSSSSSSSPPPPTGLSQKKGAKSGAVHKQQGVTAEVDPLAFEHWLNAVKSQLDQVKSRVLKLEKWFGRYEKASRVAHESVRFVGWLEAASLGEEWRDRVAVMGSRLSRIKMDCETFARDFDDITRSFVAKEPEIRLTLKYVRDAIDKTEANLSALRGAQDDKGHRDRFEDIKEGVQIMQAESVALCEYVLSAIRALVGRLDEPIKEQLV